MAGAVRRLRAPGGPKLARVSATEVKAMAENRYRVVFDGALLDDGPEREAKQLLSALFRREPDDVRQLLDGLPHVVADEVTREKAEEYLALLRRAGVASRVVRADEH
jgi:hypothetical protein